MTRRSGRDGGLTLCSALEMLLETRGCSGSHGLDSMFLTVGGIWRRWGEEGGENRFSIFFIMVRVYDEN